MKINTLILFLLFQLLFLKSFSTNLDHSKLCIQIDSVPCALYTIVKIDLINDIYIYYATNGNHKYRIIATGFNKNYLKRKKVKVGDQLELVLYPYSEFDTLEFSLVTHLQIGTTFIPIHESDWILCYNNKFAGKYYVASNQNY